MQEDFFVRGLAATAVWQLRMEVGLHTGSLLKEVVVITFPASEWRRVVLGLLVA
jgi:hypothetical protein